MDSAFTYVDLRDGPLILSIHGTTSPNDEEWAQYLALTKRHGDRQPAGKPYRGLVLTDGGAPSAKQRASFAEVMRAYTPRPLGAVVTDNALVRGVVTAIGWLVQVPRLFASDRFAEALQHLGVAADEVPAVNAAIARAIVGFECKIARKVIAAK